MELPSKTSGETSNLSLICRCCLSIGCYKDISTEYYFSGQKEVYEDMLKNTFNIEISQHIKDGLTYHNRLICENCIMSLREAFKFKQMVLQSEENILQFLVKEDGTAQNNTEKNLEEQKAPIKEELEFGDDKIYHENEECLDDMSFGDDDDDDFLSNIKLEVRRSENGVSSATRRKDIEDRKVKKRSKIENNDNTEILKKQNKSVKNWLKIAETRGNGPLLRENSLKVLANSTICVFQWHKSRYRCFCCKEPFSDMNLLRQHMATSHTIENIERKIIIQQNCPVKAEISVLCCKLCSNRFDKLNDLRNHLQTHGIKFDLNEDLLIPFKICAGNLQCQLCDQNFSVFRLLNIHMNKHYQKQVCHICGAGFSNLKFLNLHRTRSHRPLSCKECNLTFNNKIDKKNHEVSVHNLKIERKFRFPCPYCQERYSQENFRVQHLVDKHGMKMPEFQCTMCSKVFITKALCNNHKRNVHMKEKNQECDVCHHLFYTKSDLERHRVTHTGEKKFSCNLCNNLFATKDSLRRHMKRTHLGVQ